MFLQLFDFSHLGEFSKVKVFNPVEKHTLQLDKFEHFLESPFFEFEFESFETYFGFRVTVNTGSDGRK